MKNIFLFKAINGKPDFGSDANRARFNDTLKHNEGKTFRVEMVSQKRSIPQCRYYFLYLGVVSRETGHTVEELHSWAKRMFLPPKIIKVMGKELRVPSSTTELSKSEMGEYLDRIASETQISLPDRELAGFYCE